MELASVIATSGSFIPSLALILGGGAILVGFSHALWRGAQSRSWLRVPAVLVECSMSQSILSDSDRWTPRIRYAYEVDGVKYESRRLVVSPGIDFGTAADAEAWGGFREGDVCTAYVDPRRPSYAVLEPGPQLSHLVAAMLGAATVTVGILVASGMLTL
ncbi:MAG: DUF3592 domain-containing protein [Phycisphaerae bacterium]|nr:DUF3592 domain-containing protein [Phycisphaerae bacterium]